MTLDNNTDNNTEPAEERVVFTQLKCEPSDDDETLGDIPSASDLTDTDITSPEPSPVKVVQRKTGRVIKAQLPDSVAKKTPTDVHESNVKKRRKSSPVKFVALDEDIRENRDDVDNSQGLRSGGKAATVSKATKVKVKSVPGETGLKLRLKTTTTTTTTKPRPSPVTKPPQSENGKLSKPQQAERAKQKLKKVPKPKKPKEVKEPRPKKLPGKPPTIYKCSECDYQGRRKKRLTEHMGRVHGLLTANCAGRIENKSYPCDECDKTFVFGKDLSRHKKIVHHGVTHYCTMCQKSYKSKYVFDKHIATHEIGYVQPMFNCQVCPRQFTTKFSLAMHIKSEHLGIKKTFLCPTCGKSFSQIRSYRQHANVHAGIRPYVCEVCGKTFTYDKSLKEHRYMHDNIRRFACTVCNKAFRQRTCLLIHMKVHKESKDHICSSCGKGFTQKQSLIRHERIHSGVKPYTCALCRKSFSDYAVIRKHMLMSHKKEKHSWKEHCIQEPHERSEHYISGGPGYVPRDAAVQIQVKTYEGAADPSVAVVANHDASTIIDARDVPQPQDILQVAANTGSNMSVSGNIDQSEDLYRKSVTATEQDITSLISTSLADKIQAAGYMTSLYAAQAVSVPQQLTIPVVPITNIKTDDHITTVPINYSVPQNFTTAGQTEQLTEESIMNSFLKSDVYRQVARQTQGARDMFSPIITPLSAAVNTVNVTEAHRAQVAGFTVTTATTETVLAAQPGLGPWGYAGYPAYYNPANFPQFQNPQN